jgi:hypothetical protein
MPRRPAVDRPIQLTTTLPESVRALLDLHLWSEVEGRVPKGAYQAFLLERIREHFDWQSLDLAPFGLEGFVRGPRDSIDALIRKLEP